MPTYEYKILHPVTRKDAQTALDVLGDVGWEIAAVSEGALYLQRAKANSSKAGAAVAEPASVPKTKDRK